MLHFNRDLIVGTTDTASFYFNFWSDVTNGFFKSFEWLFTFLRKNIKRIVDLLLSSCLFTIAHDVVDKFCNKDTVIQSIWCNLSFLYFCVSHILLMTLAF